MKKILLAFVFAAAVLCGCKSTKVRISGRLLGLNGRQVYLEQISGGKGRIIDSVQLDDAGAYRFQVEDVGSTPSLYNIVCNGERVPLLLVGGDKVTVNTVGSLVRNYTVSGSEESELLREFNKIFIEGMERLGSILEGFSGPRAITEEDREALMTEYSKEYRRVKQAQISFILSHQNNIAAIYALYQRFPGEKYLYDSKNDIIYYRVVADAIEKSYPDSPFLPMLRSEIARMDARRTLMSRISEEDFPDISLPDMYGTEQRLSDLKGKTFLLMFWSAEAGNANSINADLKHIYDRFADKGFEIYQVGIDTSKALWVNTVQEQHLPWISVCDLRGANSPVLGVYNVSELPASYLIDTNGNIVAKNIYGEQLAATLTELVK